MTPDEIKRLRELSEKATKGPWTTDPGEGWGYHPRIYGDRQLVAEFGNSINEEWESHQNDAVFVAEARNALPRLLAAMEAERARADRLSDMLKECLLQIEYLDRKFQATGTSAGVLARINRALDQGPLA